MSAREKEIQRLISYAHGLGVKVYLKPIPFRAKNHDAGTWSTDGSEIEIFYKPSQSKTTIILSLIHELGHHLWFVYKKRRMPDLSFNKALEMDSRSGVTPKSARKKILAVERESTKFWEVIITDTNIKIPKWRIQMAISYDTWQYEHYYEHGNFPGRVLREAKAKELKKLFKKPIDTHT